MKGFSSMIIGANAYGGHLPDHLGLPTAIFGSHSLLDVGSSDHLDALEKTEGKRSFLVLWCFMVQFRWSMPNRVLSCPLANSDVVTANLHGYFDRFIRQK